MNPILVLVTAIVVGIVVFVIYHLMKSKSTMSKSFVDSLKETKDYCLGMVK